MAQAGGLVVRGRVVSKFVKKGGKAALVKADGEVRRSQAIRTYGPGSLMDLLNRAALVGGLDFWHFGPDGATWIAEPRLREAVVRQLAELDEPPPLADDKAFALPPAGLDGGPRRNVGVEVFEFPQWFVCQECRALVRAPYELLPKGERWQHSATVAPRIRRCRCAS